MLYPTELRAPADEKSYLCAAVPSSGIAPNFACVPAGHLRPEDHQAGALAAVRGGRAVARAGGSSYADSSLDPAATCAILMDRPMPLGHQPRPTAMRYLPALLSVLFPLLPVLTAQETKKPETKPVEAAPEKPAKTKIQSLKLSGAYADLPEQGVDLTALLMGGGGKPKPFFELLDRLDELAESDAEQVAARPVGELRAQPGRSCAEVERALQRCARPARSWAYIENAGTRHLPDRGAVRPRADGRPRRARPALAGDVA